MESITNNISHLKVDKFMSIAHFRHTRQIWKYLGFPMFSSRINNCDFNYIREKINSRLSWKMTLLNKVGRVTLAQSILTSMLIYTMQNLWILEGVSDKIDSTVHNFIWVNDLCHCVKWDSLTLPKSKGGLGIRSARNINISLLRNTLGI